MANVGATTGLQFPISIELAGRSSVADAQLLALGPQAVFVPDHGKSRDWREWWSEIKRAEVSRKTPHIPHLIAQQDVWKALLEGEVDLQSALILRGDLEPSFGDGLDWLVKVRTKFPQAKLWVAAYPETHPRAKSRAADLDVLREKLARGADSAITQFCYTRDAWRRFADDLAGLGIPLRKIHPGLRLLPADETESFGVQVPEALRFKTLQQREDQLRHLLDEVKAIWGADFRPHFFIMRDSESWVRVLSSMSRPSASS